MLEGLPSPAPTGNGGRSLSSSVLHLIRSTSSRRLPPSAGAPYPGTGGGAAARRDSASPPAKEGRWGTTALPYPAWELRVRGSWQRFWVAGGCGSGLEPYRSGVCCWLWAMLGRERGEGPSVPAASRMPGPRTRGLRKSALRRASPPTRSPRLGRRRRRGAGLRRGRDRRCRRAAAPREVS